MSYFFDSETIEDLLSSVVSDVCDSVPPQPFSGDDWKFLFRVVGSADCDRGIRVVCVSVATGDFVVV